MINEIPSKVQLKIFNLDERKISAHSKSTFYLMVHLCHIFTKNCKTNSEDIKIKAIEKSIITYDLFTDNTEIIEKFRLFRREESAVAN